MSRFEKRAMPMKIVFPAVRPMWVWDRQCVQFLAIADRTPIKCLISMEALNKHFGGKPTEEDYLRTFEENQDVIKEMARRKIEAGEISKSGEVLLKTTDEPAVSALKVTISPEIDEDAQLRALVSSANQVLFEITGRVIGAIQAHWKVIPDPDVRLVQLTLTGRETLTLTGRETKSQDYFSADQLGDPVFVRRRLEQLWSEFLRSLHEQQVEKLLAGSTES